MTFGRTITKDPLDTIGGRLRQAREEAGLSRRALGARSGVSERTIEHYEAGTVEGGVEKIRLLADALDVSLSWLITGEDGGEQAAAEPQGETTIVGVDQKGEAERITALLEQIDALREDGLADHQRRITAMADDVRKLARYLEPAELISLGETRGLAEVEAQSIGKITELLSADDEDEGEEILAEQPDRRAEAEAVCLELVERILDTAISGNDLYAADLNELEVFADEHDITPNRFLYFGWRGHGEIVPAIRERLRQAAQNGEAIFSALKAQNS